MFLLLLGSERADTGGMKFKKKEGAVGRCESRGRAEYSGEVRSEARSQ